MPRRHTRECASAPTDAAVPACSSIRHVIARVLIPLAAVLATMAVLGFVYLPLHHPAALCYGAAVTVAVMLAGERRAAAGLAKAAAGVFAVFMFVAAQPSYI